MDHTHVVDWQAKQKMTLFARCFESVPAINIRYNIFESVTERSFYSEYSITFTVTIFSWMVLLQFSQFYRHPQADARY
jgi:hypothetical protein